MPQMMVSVGFELFCGQMGGRLERHVVVPVASAESDLQTNSAELKSIRPQPGGRLDEEANQ